MFSYLNNLHVSSSGECCWSFLRTGLFLCSWDSLGLGKLLKILAVVCRALLGAKVLVIKVRSWEMLTGEGKKSCPLPDLHRLTCCPWEEVISVTLHCFAGLDCFTTACSVLWLHEVACSFFQVCWGERRLTVRQRACIQCRVYFWNCPREFVCIGCTWAFGWR